MKHSQFWPISYINQLIFFVSDYILHLIFIMASHIRIVSLNVNGLNDDAKRMRLFTQLMTKKADIYLLQETHIPNHNFTKKLEREWSGQWFFSIGTNRSRGVAIRVDPRSSLQVESVHYCDTEGRRLEIDLAGPVKLRIINIYAPNNPTERTDFLQNLHSSFIGNRQIIFAGDFNCIENAKLDKIGGSLETGAVGNNIINDFKQGYRIFDACREKFPDKVETTFRARDGSMECRLDRVYLSAGFKDRVEDYSTFHTGDSDHKIVSVTLSIDNLITYGPGYWKCNVSVLDDLYLANDIKRMCAKFVLDASKKDTTWWEITKRKFRDIITFHSKRLAYFRNNRMTELDRKLQKKAEENRVTGGACAEELSLLEEEMKELLDAKTEGARIRSRIQLLDASEKPSTFFIRKEKQSKERTTFKRLQTDNGILLDQASIMGAVTEYYKELYTNEPTQKEDADYLLKFTEELDPISSFLCDKPITVHECRAAIEDMKDNKSPGSDGLPKEFYAKFFDLFALPFVEMLNNAYQEGILAESQRLGLVTLVPKDSPERELLTNWRPISLLNVDYKILSKVLSSRLASVIDGVVNRDQTCCIPGRSINDNLDLIRDVIDYCEERSKAAAIVSFDQAKAFDRVSHDYLFQVLKAYGFGDPFIRWVKLLYAEAESRVIVNGHIGPSFRVLRSVRQGCPLSALLYVLCIEPLAEAIRRDEKYEGIRLPNQKHEARLCQYADDMNVFVSNIASIERVLEWFNIYEKASGAKLNATKCRGLWIGPWKQRLDSPFGFIWSTCVKFYGVFFGEGGAQMTATNIIRKMKQTAYLYRDRALPLHLRAAVINVQLCAKVWYAGSCVIFPKKSLTLMNRVIFQFLWKWKKVEPVARRTLRAPTREGGLGIFDIETKLEALRCSRIRRMLSPTDALWKEFARYWMGLTLRQEDPELISYRPLDTTGKPPAYYKSVLKLYKRVKALDNTITDFTSRKIYRTLLPTKISKPYVISQHPGVDFSRTWKVVNSRLSSPLSRELNWQIVHEVIPVNARAHRFNHRQSNACPFCGQEETILHRFVLCRLVEPAWRSIERLMFSVTGKPIKLNWDFVLFLQTKGVTNLDANLLFLLADELKGAIWRQRACAKYNAKKVTADGIWRLFRHQLANRIKADFLRLDNQTFSDLWCRGTQPLAKIEHGEYVRIIGIT